MIRVIQLLVVLFLLFLLVTQGVPWIRDRVEGITPEKLGRRLPESGDSASCIHLAHDVSALVSEQAVAASQPPGDRSRWIGSLGRIENQIYEAERACTCATDACDIARQALVEISDLVADIDRLIGGDARGAGELARRQEGINALLEQARALAR